jgi:hypothetical protein
LREWLGRASLFTPFNQLRTRLDWSFNHWNG